MMEDTKSTYRPVFLIVALITILAVFIDTYMTSKEKMADNILLENKILDTYSGLDIETFIKSNFQNVFALKAFYENSTDVSEESFHKFCSRLIDRNSYIHGLEILTTDFVIDRISPLKGNEKVIDLDLKKTPDITLETAETSLRLFQEGKDPAVLSDPAKLIQGFKGIVMIVPLVRDEKISGFAGAVINTDLISSLLRKKEVSSGVDYSLMIGDVWLQKAPINKLYREKDFRIFDKKITIGAGISKGFFSYRRLLILYSWLTLIIGIFVFFRYLDRESKKLLSEISIISKERSNLQMLMEKVLDTSRLGVVVLDSTGTVIMHNRQFNSFRDDDREVIGNNFFDQDIPNAIKQHCSAVLESNSEDVESVEIAVKRGDNILWYNCLICCPRVDKNKYCYLITQDITIKKKLLQDRFEKQKLETVGHLAAGIAHDFNNILSASSGYLEVVQQKLDTGEISEASMYMQNVERMNERAAGLVSKLLGYAKRGKTEAVVCDLREVLTSLVEMARETFPKKIEIKCSLPIGKLLIIADVNQIESAFLNILINARDAIKESGVVKIYGDIKSPGSIKALTGDTRPEGDFVEITISDTGHGMTAEILEKIFEPFFSTKRDSGGSGLGLSMCYGIFKSHGGYIFGDSIEGEGSTFTIYLPLIGDEHKEQPGEIEVTQMKEPKRLKILVIDDERDIVKFLNEALKARGHEIISATSCDDGVETFKGMKDEVDVIILDYGMPKMTGIECADLLRKIRDDVKIIMISGYTEETLVNAEIMKGKIDGFIKKPFRLNELYKLLED